MKMSQNHIKVIRLKHTSAGHKRAVTADDCHVFSSYEITWLKGTRGWQSGEPVHIMTARLQSGAGK